MNLGKRLIIIWFGMAALMLLAYIMDVWDIYACLAIVSLTIVASGLPYLIFKTDKQSRWKITTPKGALFRITLYISLLMFAVLVIQGMFAAFAEKNIRNLFAGIKGSLLIFAGVWVVVYGVYSIGHYIKRSFRVSNDEQKSEDV